MYITTPCSTPPLLPSSTDYFPVSSPAVAERVAAAYHAAIAKGTAMDELRVSTRAFVGMRKAEGLSPERALVALKGILMRESRCISLAPVCCANQESVAIEQRIYAQVFDWYLDAYFGEAGPSIESMVR